MTVFSDPGVWEILGIVLANCESSVSSIRSLRVLHVCLTLLREEDTTTDRPEAFADMCAPTGCREKKEPTISVEVVKNSEMNFFLVPGSPSFQVCAECGSCLKHPKKLLFFFLYLFHFVFILFLFIYFFVIVLFISYLISTRGNEKRGSVIKKNKE